MLTTVYDDLDLLIKVITANESWMYGYGIETKAQSVQLTFTEEPRPNKACQIR